MKLQEWQGYLSFIKDLVTVFATMIGGSVAIYGVIAWKRQLKGKTEYELARRLLRAVYKVRDAIRSVRHPAQSSGEIEAFLKEAGISIDFNSAENRSKSERAVYHVRWNKLNEAISDLRVELLEAEVSWGSKVKDKLNPLNECISELFANIALYLGALDNPHLSKTEDKEQANKRNQILYDTSRDPLENPFSGKVNNAVEVIETFLKPHLRFKK